MVDESKIIDFEQKHFESLRKEFIEAYNSEYWNFVSERYAERYA